MVTTKEPDEKEGDKDEMVFISAWCCVASEDLPSETVLDDPDNQVDEKEEDEYEMIFVTAWCCVASGNLPSDTTITHLQDKDDKDSVGYMPILKGREDYDSSDDENSHDEENDSVSLKAPKLTEAACNNDVHVPKMKPEGGWLSRIYHYFIAKGGWALLASFVAVFGPVIQKSHHVMNPILGTVETVWRLIAIPVCFFSTIMWDTLGFLTEPAAQEAEPPLKGYEKVNRDQKPRSSVSQSVFRKSVRRAGLLIPSHEALFLFATSWLIFSSAICVSHEAYQGAIPMHPFERASQSISSTRHQIDYLNTIVDLSPGTVVQYKKLKAREWRSETFPRAKVTMEIESHCDSDSFDTYEDFPVETGEYFFDAEEEIDLDPVTDLCDLLNLDSIYKSRTVVGCTVVHSSRVSLWVTKLVRKNILLLVSSHYVSLWMVKYLTL
jgi:hypothetical protein